MTGLWICQLLPWLLKHYWQGNVCYQQWNDCRPMFTGLCIKLTSHKPGSWSIRQLPDFDQAAAWLIRLLPDFDLACAWSIRQQPDFDQAAAWSISLPPDFDLACAWSIRQPPDIRQPDMRQCLILKFGLFLQWNL